MKKYASLLVPTLLSFMQSFSQSTPVAAPMISGKLNFDQGQTIAVTLDVKTTVSQQAMGQSIDFNIDASAGHQYKVTNANSDNATLHHQVKNITFSFEGMGQKRKFDSNNEKDLNGQFGKPVKEMLSKQYDLIIDSIGRVMMAVPENFTLAEGDSRLAIINNMLKDVVDLVQPPAKGKSSFFQVFPAGTAGKGATWTTKEAVSGGMRECAYVINEITDSTIVVDLAENATTVTKAEMMGNETTTTLHSKTTGKIIVDRLTGIIREKTTKTESSGNTESAFGTLPVTSKTTTVIKVKSE